jgi:hypothetical protein
MDYLSYWQQNRSEKWVSVGVSGKVNSAQMEVLQRGHDMVEPEDRWAIFFRENTLYFMRWTGICFFEIKFGQVEGEWFFDSIGYNGNKKEFPVVENDQVIRAIVETVLSFLGVKLDIKEEWIPDEDEII